MMRKGSLKRVFLGVIAGTYLIGTAAAFAAFYYTARDISSRYVGRFALSQNLLEKNRILSIVERELALSRKLADDPQIVSWLENPSDPGLRQAAERQLESYLRFLGYHNLFIAILSNQHYYVNPPGDVVLSKTILDPDVPSDRWFFDTIRKNRDYSLNVDYNTLLKETRVWINVIVRNDRGEAVGVAGSGMDFTSFLENLLAHKEPGISTIIVNSKGELQAHRDISLIEHNARVTRDADKITVYDLIDTPEDRAVLKQAIDAARQGLDTQMFHLRMDGKKELTVIAAITELDWFNLVLVDAGSIIGIPDFLPLILLFFASMALVLAGVLLLLNRLILTPLGSLTRAAGVVAQGNYDTLLPERADNEIGHLSASFNAMTKQIRNYIANLEAMVEDRTAALTLANKELTETQNRIIDSIQYAKLIQHSILPSPSELDGFLPDYFTILQPLDLVGGDFYFFRETGDGFCIAVVDCTGHGVPGAFMTMMANALLNRVIETSPETGPAGMLERLHLLIVETLRGETDIAYLENGLDIALCRVYLEKKEIVFAGGGLPLFVWQNGDVLEIPGDRIHLGFTASSKKRCFKQHRMEIKSQNRYYLSTDGLFDLPGGEKGFGLGRRGVKALIAKQSGSSLKEQGPLMLEALDGYRGHYLCRDDLTFIGFSLDIQEET